MFERHLVQATEGAARTLSANAADPDAAYLEMRERFNLDSLPGPRLARDAGLLLFRLHRGYRT